MGERNKFYTKEEVIEIMKKLHKNGDPLYSSKVDGNLRNSAIFHFGKWTNAKKEAGIDPKKKFSEEHKKRLSMSKIKYTPEKVKDALMRASEEGITTSQFIEQNKNMYDHIVSFYGGTKKACIHFGIEPLPIKPRELKYTKEDLDNYLKERYKKGSPMSLSVIRREKHWSSYVYRKYYSSWNEALEANGIPPVQTKRKSPETKEELIEMIVEMHKNGDDSYRNLYKKINKFFGSMENMKKELGIETQQKPEPKFFTVEQINQRIKEMYEDDSVEKICQETMGKELADSIRCHFGTLHNYFNQLDIDYYRKPVPFYWTKETLKRQLKRWVTEGKPLNYNFMIHSHPTFIEAARKIFGSYAALFEACDLNYEDYRTDTVQASYYGYKFEDAVGELLKALGYTFTKYETDVGLQPDFIIGDTWMDAKLSRWTIVNADDDTIEKYEQYCNRLIIVYLRGKVKDERITPKTTVISVYKLIDQLPESKREDFFSLFKSIETEIDGVVA